MIFSDLLLQQVCETIENKFKDRTVFVITHKYDSFVEIAHPIIVLRNGRIDEQGTHEQLYEKGG